jgi:hypothetical protein
MMIWLGNIGGDIKDRSKAKPPAWGLDVSSGVKQATRPVTFSAGNAETPGRNHGVDECRCRRRKKRACQVEPQSISTIGFNAVFSTWSDSVTYGISASWIAIAV